MKSTRAGSERFFADARFEKLGNTAYIPNFSNRSSGEKDPLLRRRRFIQRLLKKASNNSVKDVDEFLEAACILPS